MDLVESNLQKLLKQKINYGHYLLMDLFQKNKLL